MIAFDSNVLIYTMRLNTDFQDKAVEVFRQIALEGGVCSTLVITESLYGSIVALKQIPILLSSTITVVSVTPDIAELAGQLKVKHGLKNIDAIHIATALTAGAKTFVTNDQHILNKKVPGIKIHGL